MIVDNASHVAFGVWSDYDFARLVLHQTEIVGIDRVTRSTSRVFVAHTRCTALTGRGDKGSRRVSALAAVSVMYTGELVALGDADLVTLTGGEHIGSEAVKGARSPVFEATEMPRFVTGTYTSAVDRNGGEINVDVPWSSTYRSTVERAWRSA